MLLVSTSREAAEAIYKIDVIALKAKGLLTERQRDILSEAHNVLLEVGEAMRRQALTTESF